MPSCSCDARIKASIERFDSGVYTRLQFSVPSVSLGAHTEAFQCASDSSDDDAADAVAQPNASASPTSATGADDAAQSSTADAAQLCEVCLVAPRSGVALVPCGHS